MGRGVRAVFGIDMPVYPKRRFQDGSTTRETAARLFTGDEARYRRHFLALHA